jgi:hypothetical protein
MEQTITRYIGSRDSVTAVYKHLLSKARAATVENKDCLFSKKVKITVIVEEE